MTTKDLDAFFEAGWNGHDVDLLMTFMSGVQLLFLGVIGEYLGRIYGETKARPQYVVSQIIGGD